MYEKYTAHTLYAESYNGRQEISGFYGTLQIPALRSHYSTYSAIPKQSFPASQTLVGINELSAAVAADDAKS